MIPAPKRTCGIFLIDRSNRFLVAHPTGHSDDFWSIPKGIANPEEEYTQAAYREFLEETGFDILLLDGGFGSLGAYSYNRREGVPKILHAFYFKTEGDLSETDFFCDSMFTNRITGKRTQEVDDFKWIGYNEGIRVLNKTQVQALWFLNEYVTKIVKE